MTDAPSALPLGGDFALGPIGQISLPVQNLARAVSFYHDRLGLPLEYQAADLAFFNAGGVGLLLNAAAPAAAGVAAGVGAAIHFKVEDIRRAYQALVERGVRFTQPPGRVAEHSGGELWMVFFRDSENNLLALMSERAR